MASLALRSTAGADRRGACAVIGRRPSSGSVPSTVGADRYVARVSAVTGCGGRSRLHGENDVACKWQLIVAPQLEEAAADACTNGARIEVMDVGRGAGRRRCDTASEAADGWDAVGRGPRG